MYSRESLKYGKIIKIIYPGEFYISDNNELIGTILGSCVSVCLHDPALSLSGMNHYMLPGRISNSDIFRDRSAKYGITAIYELIDEIKKAGARMDNLIAKVFGGGHVLEAVSDSNPVPKDNVRLALAILELEDIPIIQIDVGGKFTRKLMFDVKTGHVYLRKTTREQTFETEEWPLRAKIN